MTDRTIPLQQRIKIRLADFFAPSRVVGVTDDTPALLAAMAEASAQALAAGRRYEIQLPPGNVFAHEVPWDDQTPWVGSEVGHSRLYYNGAGGPGSYLIGNPKIGGATPFSGFSNLSCYGWSATSGGICETGYKVTGTTEVDWGFRFDRVQFSYFTGEAVDLGTGVVNLHLDRVRWDGIGGHALRIRQKDTDANRPFTLSRFSVDNVLPTAYANALTAAGYDITNWGAGVIKADPGSDMLIAVRGGRIEMNRSMRTDNGRRSLFQIVPTPGKQGRILIENVGCSQKTRDAVVGVWAPNGGVAVSLQGPVSLGAALNFEDGTDPSRNISTGDKVFATNQASVSQDQGLWLNGLRIETRSVDPGNQTDADYRPGDIIHRKTLAPGSKGAALLVIGAGSFSTSVLTTVNTTAGSAVIAPVDVADMFRLPVGKRLSIAGAGAGAAALVATVVSVDIDAATVTLSVTAGTTVTGASVTRPTPDTRETLDIISYGIAPPTSGTWAAGEKRYNTAPAAGQPVGWVCVLAGTPGTWQPFGYVGTSAGATRQPGTGIVLPAMVAGNYYSAASPSAVSTGALTIGSMRVAPLPVPADFTLDKLGLEVTTAVTGGAVRLVLYKDNGSGRPGSLHVDGGPIDATTVGYKETAALATVVPAGDYWIGSVSQGANDPTVRTLTGQTPGIAASSTPSATTYAGYVVTGVTGAAPAVFGTPGAAATVGRVHAKAG